MAELSTKTAVVLFDVGGTLLHLNPKVFETKIRRYLPDYKISADFRTFDINSKTYCLSGGTDVRTIQIRYFENIFRQLKLQGDLIQPLSAELAEMAMTSSKDLWNDLDKDALEILAYLKPKYRLGIISNNIGDAEIQLQTAGIDQFFDVIIDSHVLALRKPDPKIFLYAAEKLQVKPEDCTYVGDMFEWDDIGAVNAHMPAILVSASPESRTSALAYPGIKVLDTLYDLKTVL